MKSIIWSRKPNFFIMLLVIVSFAACRKSKIEPEAPAVVPLNLGPNTKQTPTTDRTFLTNDSLFLYAQQIYFWNDALPSYDTFDPRKYKTSPDINGYNQELFDITRFKINPSTGKPYEYSSTNPSSTKYSYINDILSNNPQPISNTPGAEAAVDLAGNGNDIGIRAVFYLTSNTAPRPYLLFVTAVYPGSPADKAGVKRGWVIKTVNGASIGASYDSEASNVLASMDASSVSLTGYNYADNAPFNLALTKASYKSSPVYASKVITKSGRKIGYLSYARFSALTNFDTPSDLSLDPVFADFAAQGVTDLIIDLRYNGGGYIESATYLANLISPPSLSGKKMYTEIYNSTMQSGKATILANQPLLDAAGKIRYRDGKMLTYADLNYSSTAAINNTYFSKKGSVNGINNVVFIVSGSTASASELLINSLKPYLNVKLVGTTTYGKPVGFFPIVLQNRYEVFMSLFETRNSNNEGGYYNGMVPEVISTNDTPTFPFGDERDSYTALALNVLVPGAATVASNKTSSVDARGVTVQSVPFNSANFIPLDPNSEFVGMIETRKGLK
jgi:carboxyl-terminal processing protease